MNLGKSVVDANHTENPDIEVVGQAGPSGLGYSINLPPPQIKQCNDEQDKPFYLRKRATLLTAGIVLRVNLFS